MSLKILLQTMIGCHTFGINIQNHSMTTQQLLKAFFMRTQPYCWHFVIYIFDINHAIHPSLNNLNDAVKNIWESLNRRYNIKDEEDNIFVELSIFLKAVARYIFWNYVYIKTNWILILFKRQLRNIFLIIRNMLGNLDVIGLIRPQLIGFMKLFLWKLSS